MSNKLYIGSLAWATTSETLRSAFEEYGEVAEANVITDRETGRSRGFGFVTFAKAEDAESALALNGTELDGRTIVVNFAQERTDRRGGPGVTARKKFGR